MQGRERAILLRGGELLLVEGAQRTDRHDRRVNDLARLQLEVGLEHLDRAVRGRVLNADDGGRRARVRALRTEIVAGAHVRDARLAAGGPRAERVRVLARVRLDLVRADADGRARTGGRGRADGNMGGCDGEMGQGAGGWEKWRRNKVRNVLHSM